MGIPRTNKNEVRIKEQPPTLHGRAMDNLEYIRGAIESSTEFTAVPGYGGALMGLTAIGATIIAGNQGNVRGWLITWLVEAFLAILIGLITMWQKSRLVKVSLNSKPAKKFIIGFLPPVLAGIVVTLLLASNGHFTELPTAWLVIYGAAVITGGAYSVRIVPVMGWCFLFLGAISAFLPQFGNVFMGIGFGAFHLVFGLLIARKYGG